MLRSACIYHAIVNVLIFLCHGETLGDSAFASFMRTHARDYAVGTEEHRLREQLFLRRVAEVEVINGRPEGSWRAKVNKYADWTEAELMSLQGWRGVALPSRGGRAPGLVQQHVSLWARDELPEAVAWTNLSSSAQVLNQGMCGSCWAASTAKALDMHREIYAPAATAPFSVQELVNCVPNPHRCGGTGGCEGATTEMGFAYALKYGLSSTAQTPYMATTGFCGRQASLASGTAGLYGTLGAKGTELLVPLEGAGTVGVFAAEPGYAGPAFGLMAWERLPENAYLPLMEAVAHRGPVTVSVDGSKWSYYSSGIFDHCDRDAVIGHAVILMGYGSQWRKNYWLVRNSWGADWGEAGDIRLIRHEQEEELCGTDRQPELGTGCENGPAEVRVCGTCGILYDSVVPHFGKAGVATPLL